MFRKILVPLDGSALAEQALPAAAALARASGASIDLVRVHETLPVLALLQRQRSFNRWSSHDAYLQSIAELMSGHACEVTHAALEGDPAEVITERALNVFADVIVMTSHGHGGFSKLWLGSVTDAVVRAVRIPVLVVRPTAATHGRSDPLPSYKRILVTLDGSALSTSIFSSAAKVARCGDARILLLHVVQPVPLPDANGSKTLTPVVVDQPATDLLVERARAELAAAAEQLTAIGVSSVESRVVVDPHVALAIVRFAADHRADLIAMATHGRGVSRLMTGSVADKVLRASRLPVLLHRRSAIMKPSVLLSEAEMESQLPALSGR